MHSKQFAIISKLIPHIVCLVSSPVANSRIRTIGLVVVHVLGGSPQTVGPVPAQLRTPLLLSSPALSLPLFFPAPSLSLNPSASPLPPIRPSHGDKYSPRVSGGLRVYPDSSRPLYYPCRGLRCADNVGRSRSLPSNCTSLASPIMAHSLRNRRARMVLTFHTLCHSIPPSKMLPSPQIQLAVTASPTFSCSPCFSSSHGIRPVRWVVASTPPSSLPSLPPSPS